MAAEKKKPSAIIIFGGGFLALCVSFVVYGTLFMEDRHAPFGTPPSAPPASVEQPVLYESPLDVLLKDESLARAIIATKPLMQDSHNEMNVGAAHSRTAQNALSVYFLRLETRRLNVLSADRRLARYPDETPGRC